MNPPTLRALARELRDLHRVLVLGGGTYCWGALEPEDPPGLQPVDINLGWDRGWAVGPYGREDVPGDDCPFDATAAARRLICDIRSRTPT